ncbi:MAG: MOSC N-terminal beta barrel domain-containing protein, partial [Lacibacter sp.]
MLSISHLYVYPIKSLGGIELTEARLTDRGIEHDRRWMLTDENNRFLTQREFP